MINTTAELGDRAPAAANDATAELDQALAAANDATAEFDQAATDAARIVRFALGDLVFEIDLMAITGPEWRDLKKLTGLHQRQLVRDALLWEDFDAQAAFVWLAVHQQMPDVEYETVLSMFSYAAFEQG